MNNDIKTEETSENIAPLIKEKIDELKNSTDFAKAVEEASASRVKIMTDLSKSMKENKKEYLQHMISSYEKKTSNSFKQLDKDEKQELQKEWNDTFNNLRRFNHGVMSVDQKEKFHEKLAKQFSTILKWWNYLGDNRLNDELLKYGLKVSDSTPLEKSNIYLSEDTTKQSMNSIFANVNSIQGVICAEADNIKINIFENAVPSSLRYDKKTNPVGMRKGDFNNIVTIAASMTINEEKATKKALKKAETLTFEAASKNIVREGITNEMT